MIGADPDYFFESRLLGWGAAKLEDFAPDQLGRLIARLARPRHDPRHVR
ncbi:MAG: hypothetical protein R3D85_09890 [Paracoccaceae bacterium]